MQTAVDSQHKLMIANDVTNDTGDRDWRSPMALQAKEVLSSPFDAGADVGYDHGEEVKTCLEAGITPYVAWPVTSANQKLGLFSQDDFMMGPPILTSVQQVRSSRAVLPRSN